jgi:hypothetical protein
MYHRTTGDNDGDHSVQQQQQQQRKYSISSKPLNMEFGTNNEHASTAELSHENMLYPNLMDITSNEYIKLQNLQFYDMMDKSIVEKGVVKYAGTQDFCSVEKDTTSTTSSTTLSSPCNTNSYKRLVKPLYLFQSTKEPSSLEGRNHLPPFVVHSLRPNDTLMKLAIGYGVLEEQIKMANNILTELAYFNKSEIIIPYPTIIPNWEHTPEIEQNLEKKKREWTLRFFTKLKGVSVEEATYYLSLHNYELRPAVCEYDEDVKWQKEFEQKKLQERRDSMLQKKESIAKRLLNLLSLCVPLPHISTALDKEYNDLELDQIDDGIIDDDEF